MNWLRSEGTHCDPVKQLSSEKNNRRPSCASWGNASIPTLPVCDVCDGPRVNDNARKAWGKARWK